MLNKSSLTTEKVSLRYIILLGSTQFVFEGVLEVGGLMGLKPFVGGRYLRLDNTCAHQCSSYVIML